MARPLLGRDVFARGAPEGLDTIDQPVFELSLYDLLKAYGDSHRRQHSQVLTILPSAYQSLSEAMEHLARFVGRIPEWRDLFAFLPEALRAGPLRRSAVAATFAASLEMAKAGQLELRQERAFGPLYLRSGPPVSRPE
jgi:segregation and condensation protein A